METDGDSRDAAAARSGLRHGPSTPRSRRAAGLTVEHEGQTYYFCGRGCRLEFLDDPKRFFDPDYLPHM